MNASWAVLVSAGLLSAVSGIVAGSVVFSILRRRLLRSEKMNQAAKQALARDLKALGNALRQTIERLGATERRVREAIERQNRLEMMAPSTERFKHAIALVQRGASAGELMATCGLARGEAELLYLLHRSSANPSEVDNLA